MNWWEQWKWFRLQGKAFWSYDPQGCPSGRTFWDKSVTRLHIIGLEYPIHSLKLRRDWIEKL